VIRGLVTTQELALVQFGITNSLGSRLGKHAGRGFTQVTGLWHFTAGSDAQAAESRMKQALRGRYRSCHEQGIRFDGSTESFLESTLSLDRLLYAASAATCSVANGVARVAPGHLARCTGEAQWRWHARLEIAHTLAKEAA